MTQIHEEKWEGQDVYVVGAAKGDLKSKQFWIEKNRLLFVRLIEPDEHDASENSRHPLQRLSEALDRMDFRAC